MSDGGAFPEFILCDIRANSWTSNIQSVRMATRGPVPLSLQDRVGSLLVESCGILTCLQVARYTVLAQNVGGRVVNVTRADFRVGQAETVFEDVLTPGNFSVFETSIEFNTCRGPGLSAQLSLAASSENGDSCSDEEFLLIDPVGSLGDPSPENGSTFLSQQLPSGEDVSCGLSVSIGCVITSTDPCLSGIDCSATIPSGDVCLKPPHGITFLVGGGPCEESGVDFLPAGRASCEDFNGGPSWDFDTLVHLRITADRQAGNESLVYFDGIVKIGGTVFFSEVDTQNVTSINSFSDRTHFVSISTADQSALLQRLTYESSCVSTLNAARLGSLRFFEVLEVQSAFDVLDQFSGDVNLPITIRGPAEGDAITLLKLSLELNSAGTTDLTPQILGEIANPNGTSANLWYGFFEGHKPEQLIVRYTVEGVRASDGTNCTGAGSETLYVAPFVVFK